MAAQLLLNNTSIYTGNGAKTYVAGESISDPAVQAALQGQGGILWSAGDSIVAAQAAVVQKYIGKSNTTEGFLTSLMMAAAVSSANAATTPQSVLSLRAYSPRSSRDQVTVDQYSTPGDGGGGTFVWNATDTRADDGGTIIAVTGVATGRWNRIFSGGFDVRWFGAKGDGVTDCTAALTAAVAAWVAAMIASPQSGFRLYFPPGKYMLGAPLVVVGIKGGVIEGAGLFASVLQDTGASAFCGARAMLELQDCQHVTVRDIQISGQAHATLLAGNVSASATSITVQSAANIAVGQRIALLQASLLVAEELCVTSISGTTIGVTGPAGSTLFSYSTNDFVIIGPLATLCCSTNFQASGKTSHGNKFERVGFNNSQTVNCLYSYASDARGGAPTVLAANVTAGASSMTVRDATQMYVGQQVQMWDGISGGSEVVTIASVTPATGVVGIVGTFAHNHTSGVTYVVSASDVNNDEHLFHQCVFLNGGVAGIGLQGWNALNNLFVACEASGSYAIASYRQGGSLKWVGGDAGGQGTDFEIGGGMHRPTQIIQLGSESSAPAIVVHAGDVCQGLTLWLDRYDKKGLPLSGNVVDITAASLAVSMHGCNFIPGAPSGYTLSFVDTAAAGRVTMAGQCRIGMSTLVLNGAVLTDTDTQWSIGKPTETLSNGGAVRAMGATYGIQGVATVAPVERRPVVPVVLVNGDNDSVPLLGDGDVIVTGPTAAYGLKGFSTGFAGQRARVKFNVNQQLTIHNNSSAAVPILTSTGADVTLPAPGGFVLVDFWCDGTNWNLV